MSGLFSKPKVQKAPEIKEIKTPVVNQEQVDRDTADIMRKRRGFAATVLTSGDSGTTAGSVGANKVLG
jgi:hypothetical protein